MIVYRVENASGLGPYRDGAEVRGLCAAHGWGDEHPNPFGEKLWTYQEDHIKRRDQYCGFATLEKLHAWFDGWQESLATAGFRINRYYSKLGKTRVGERQVTFVLDEATALGTVPW